VAPPGYITSLTLPMTHHTPKHIPGMKLLAIYWKQQALRRPVPCTKEPFKHCLGLFFSPLFMQICWNPSKNTRHGNTVFMQGWHVRNYLHTQEAQQVYETLLSHTEEPLAHIQYMRFARRALVSVPNSHNPLLLTI
jgi:hypothetical protein